MRGVITHVYSPKISSACTTSLKNILNTLEFAPFLPKIIDRCAQLLLAFHRFTTTYIQSSYDDVMIRPSYLKDITNYSGLP